METHVYAKRPERELALDVFSPAEPNGTAIILVHGGGFLVGAKEALHAYAEPLLQHGFTVIAINYRLRTEVLWPAPVEDMKAAIAWVRDHADELRIAPDKIVLEGFSAGAMLSLLSGREAGVAAVVAFFAPAMTVTDRASPMHIGLHLSDEEVAGYSPLSAITPGYPPTMILHGMDDSMLSPDEHALALFAKLREVGAKCDLRLYHGAVHEFCMEPGMLPVQDDVALFIKRAVVSPEKFAEEGRKTNPFLMPPESVPPLPAPLLA